MENTVTNRQLVFILFLTLTTMTLSNIPKVMAQSAGVGSWVPLIATSLVFGILVLIIVKLNNMHHGKVLYEYGKELVGKAGILIISIVYIIYFLIIAVYLTSSYTNTLSADLLFKTPHWATTLTLLIVCGYATYKGITNVARLFEILGVLFLLAVVSVHVLMLFQGNINNILPFYVPSETGKYFAAMKDAIFPFLGIEVLFIIPFTAKNNKNSGKTAFITMLGIGLLYVLVVETSIMMVGMNEIVYHQNAMTTAIRQVELGFIEFFKRVDVIYLVVGLMSSNAGIIIVFLSLVEYLCRLLPKVKRIAITLCVGIVIFILRLIVLEINNFNKIFDKYIIYFGLATAIFIPLLLFVIAKVKIYAHKKN